MAAARGWLVAQFPAPLAGSVLARMRILSPPAPGKGTMLARMGMVSPSGD
ncbi:hypothetical protein ACFYM2_26460 [Streptomyces sp. NPDC006711]